MKIAVRVSPPRRSGTIDGQRHVCVHTFIAPQSLLYSTIRTLCSLHVCNHESATMNRARPTFDRTLCMHGVTPGTNRQAHAFILFCTVPPSVSHICHHQAQSQKTRSLIKSWVWFSLSLCHDLIALGWDSVVRGGPHRGRGSSCGVLHSSHHVHCEAHRAR